MRISHTHPTQIFPNISVLPFLVLAHLFGSEKVGSLQVSGRRDGFIFSSVFFFFNK